MKDWLLFSLGVLVGAGSGIAGTWKYFKDKYEKKADEEIEDMKDYFWHRDQYEYESSDEEVNPVDKEADVPSREKGVMSPEERKEIKDKLHKNWEGTTDYAKMYHRKEETDQNEEGEEPEDPEEAALEEMDRLSEEHAQNAGRKPRIISYEEASNLSPHIQNDTLYYYTLNEVVVTDNEEIVEDPSLLIGDCLMKYDFINSDERLIFVLNYDLDICYEVQKVDGYYSQD